MTKDEKQNIKLEKVDDKTAYENLLIKYAELENKIADIKANCDLAIEGRDIKIKELEEKNTELEKESNRLFLEGAKRVEELEKENAELKERLAEVNLNGNIVLRELTKAKKIIELFVQWNYGCCKEPDYKDIVKQAEQFLKEIEK